MVGWIYPELFWFRSPDFTDVFKRREAAECLKPSRVIVSIHEIRQVDFKLIVIVAVKAFHRCLFQCPVHYFHLPVGPGVVDFDQAVLDPMLVTSPVEDVVSCIFVLLAIGELHAIIGQDRVDSIR